MDKTPRAELPRLLDELTVAHVQTVAAYHGDRQDEGAAADQKIADIIRRIKALQDR